MLKVGRLLVTHAWEDGLNTWVDRGGWHRIGEQACVALAASSLRQVCRQFVANVLQPLPASGQYGVLAYGPMLGHSWITGRAFSMDGTGWMFPVFDVKTVFPRIVSDALTAMGRMLRMCGLDVEDKTRRPLAGSGS